MKRLLLLLFSFMSLQSIADNVAVGEYVEYMNGIPTQDHFFVRGSYDDKGAQMTYDNVVSFKGGDTQLVWIYLNDDEIYENEEIQALTPQAYNSAGELYNEITYNGFQFDVYLPQTIDVIFCEDDDTGEEIYFERGERLPATSTISWAKLDRTKEIDGIVYDVYTFTCYNDKAYGTHLSGRNPKSYQENGALKKDYTLLGIYLQNKNQEQPEGRINDMIIGNTILNLKEYKQTFFFYGTGGMGVENRFMQYNRVQLYGSKGIDGEGSELSENYFSMPNVSVFQGDTIVVPVAMTNEESIISFQTDLYLPEGIELLQQDGEYIIDPSDRMTRTHSIISNDVSNGAIRVLCYSSNYKPFTGNSGDDLFYFTVKVADDAEGDYTIQLKNTLFTTSDFEEIAAPDVAANVKVKAYLLGDANNSGTVTVTDVVVTSQYVLEMNPQPFIFEAADVNFDGTITVTDVSRIAWMVLNPTMNTPLRAPALWNYGDCLSTEGISLSAGETRTVSIALDNVMDYAAFQFDLNLPDGLTASNIRVTDRAASHAFDVNTLANGKTRVLCYSPTLAGINGHEGTLLTFDVTAIGIVKDDIFVDGIELVTTACQTVKLDALTVGVNYTTAVTEWEYGKDVAKVEYYNLAGQQLAEPASGVTLVVTTYTDGTRVTNKVIK